MEQGRVQLDSDWNEWLAEFSRRIQAGTLDIMGHAVYPATTPYAFQITPSSPGGTNTISIGCGRMYVDGLLAENHGDPTKAVWDPALAELSGSPQPPPAPSNANTVDFAHQPHYPGATLPTGTAPYLFYLDVWTRPVTWLEDPHLIDQAVGVDTTGRLQTVWQVKYMAFPSGATYTCATPDSQIAYPAASAGLLSTNVVPNPSAGPCCLTAGTGYTGVENQFYRVEIHQAGQGSATPNTNTGTATFKWSRDNASVETGVTAITSGTDTAGNPASVLTVMSLGRDQVLGFSAGDWIEILDDWTELWGIAGILCQIDSVDPAAKTITLTSTIPTAATAPGSTPPGFPVNSSGNTDSQRHTRIRRWDQSGTVYYVNVNGTRETWCDLSTTGGVIPVPAPGATLVLEDGITVTFNTSPSGGSFNIGDFWTFAARTDGSVGTLVNAPPRGIHHHYTKLALVTFPSTATDCRVEWPPSETGCACGCTVTVQPSDITADNTLQNILDKYKNQQTSTAICLMPGEYSLASPLRFTSAHNNITLQACEPGTVSINAQTGEESQFSDGMVVLDDVTNVTLSGLQFNVPLVTFSATTFGGLPITSLDPEVTSIVENLVVSIGVRAMNCTSVTIANCQFGFADFSNANANPFGVGVFAGGQCSGLQLTGNEFAGVGDFLAGVLLAPSVSFTPPAAASRGSVFTGRATIAGTVEKAVVPLKAAGATESEVQPREATKTITSTSLSTPALISPILGLGKLQTILNQGTSTPNLAASGGTVIPSTLTEAVFKENSFSGMTVAVLILGECESVDFLSNEVDDCNAGFWLLSPVQAQMLLLDPQNIAVIGATVAMGYPLPQQDTTPTTTVTAAPASVRIYTGASSYTDSQGNIWTPDVDSKAVTIIPNTPKELYHLTNSVPTISGTNDPTLYQSERYGTFSYTFNNLPTGYYKVTLKFAEIFYTDNSTNRGVRIFDVSINGQQVLTNFDIVADAGGADIADDKVFPNIVPNAQAQIVVLFTGTSNGSDHNAKISAVEVDPQWSGAPYLGSGAERELTLFFDQLAQVAEQAFASLTVSTPQLRLTDNEMQALSAAGLLLLGSDSVENANVSSLMMTGNRMDGLVGSGNSDDAAFLQLTNIVGRAGSPYFSYTATIVQVSRCVVSGNMAMNEQTIRDANRSFCLNDAAVLSAQLMVVGNIFKGSIAVLPLGSASGNTVPYSLDRWNNLNTVIL
jgi:hypothetical protein